MSNNENTKIIEWLNEENPDKTPKEIMEIFLNLPEA